MGDGGGGEDFSYSPDSRRRRLISARRSASEGGRGEVAQVGEVRWEDDWEGEADAEFEVDEEELAVAAGIVVVGLISVWCELGNGSGEM